MSSLKETLIVFDLFGTLIATPNPLEVRQLLEEIAQHCEGPSNLYDQWVATSQLRDSGAYLSPNQYWQSLGVLDPIKANLLYSRTNDYWLSNLRVDALEIISSLHKNYIIGLCSNAGFETHNLLKNKAIYQYFDSVIISADIKSLKPETAMYQSCITSEVSNQKMFFIGDGGSDELKGAQQNNFIPIQIKELKHDHTTLLRPLNEKYITINQLNELAEIILEELEK